MNRLVLLIALVFGASMAAGMVGLPDDISGYEKWTKVATNLKTDGPHSGTNKVVYANEAAAKAWKGTEPLPVGSLVVKTGGDEAAPNFVAIMRKTKDGWFYEEYAPGDGKFNLLAGGAGKQAQCSACHSGAQKKDFLFTRP